MAEFNSVNEEIRNEAKKVLQSKKGLDKVKYFVYYYKTHFIVAVGAIALITSIIVWYATMKDTIFQVTVVNGALEDECDYEAFMNDYASTIQFDPKEEKVDYDSSFHINLEAGDQYNQTMIQKVFVGVSVAQMDVMLCDEDFMKLTRAQDMGIDFRKILTEDQFARFEDNMVWYDFPKEELLEITENENLQKQFEEDYNKQFAGRNEPVCIDVSDFAKIKSSNMFMGGKAYLFIPGNAPNLENAINFIEYLATP